MVWHGEVPDADAERGGCNFQEEISITAKNTVCNIGVRLRASCGV